MDASLRNVLVIGKTGAGKSTVANKIIGEERFKVKRSIESETSYHVDHEVILTDRGNRYRVKVVDTVGFQDTARKDGTKISNEENIRRLKQYFRSSVPDGLHLIIFVFREGRLTDEEKQTFDFIIANFEVNIKPVSALVITNCESLSQIKKNEIISEFRTHPTTRPIANLMGKGIYTVGFPDIDDLADHLKVVYTTQIQSDVDILRRLVYSCDTGYLSKELFDDTFWDTFTSWFSALTLFCVII